MPEISETGIYFDTKANKVVESVPEEGVQIVAPGGEITDAAKAARKRLEETTAGVVSEPETVTTESVSAKKSAKSS